ncbi:alpha-1,6-glucosidase domain-containing protein [Gayadomonas joobiniege]|uniref:alpha-1,6-glucosidase domain-containing protein n=1 Tax=Gayadomonas joobiniege TaxID=1234606 RepID=UPI00035E5E55|nr:alpha-1,6-glucosidase domain-containing protein [Gayadomonas joobiniege]
MKFNHPFNLLPLATLISLSLAGCGGAGNDTESGQVLLSCENPQVPNAAGDACVDPEPIFCPVPTVPDEKNESCVAGVDPTAPDPVYFPKDNEAVLYFNKADGEYEGYRLHTWNNDACDSYAPSAIAASWDNGLVHTDVDPNYGAYWVLQLKEGFGDCGNFIIHVGTDDAGKEMGGSDFKMPLKQADDTFARMNFTFSKEASVFEYPVVSLGERPLAIEGRSAHMVDAYTLVWDTTDVDVAEVKLHSSMAADIQVDDDSNVSGDTVAFSATNLTAEQADRLPAIASWPAYSASLTADESKKLLKAQLVAVAYNSDGKPVKASYVQTAKALDALYTMGEQDADEAELGVIYDNGAIISSVWAPTAQKVRLKVYDADKSEIATHDMDYDEATGIWRYEGDSGLDRKFYQFEVTVYHPVSEQLETLLTSDPYSVSLSTNGEYSQFVNLDDADLKPVDWDSHSIPTITNIEDAVLLEGHIRDFSILDTTVSEKNRGKYLAFTETDSNAVQYLKRLQSAGVTHFHMLPANDIATIEENPSDRIDLNNTVAELCEVKSESKLCGQGINDQTLMQVLEDIKFYEFIDAQELITEIQNLDGFNWGYDPHHFNAPEGSYASDPDGVARIKEMREMNKALHEMGLRVVLDVVYNHTSASGLWDNSVFDKVVPGYYHRLNEETGAVYNSSCCDNTATENKMFDKFIKDSLVMWAEHYKFDSFRFDIMGHLPVETILEARDLVAEIDPDTYFYGEGWNFGDDVRNDRLFTQATQPNLAGSEVGTFNDRPRDHIRSGTLFNEDGSLNSQDQIRLGLAGTISDFLLKSYQGGVAEGSSYGNASYAKDPADVINYISKHDNETLWDQLQYGLPASMSLNERVRAHSQAAAIPLLSQGIPFFQLGVDLLRSKSMDRDSYNSGDWFNRIDLSGQTHNWNIGLPVAEKNEEKWPEILKLSVAVDAAGVNELMHSQAVFEEFLRIRQDSPLFRLTTANDIINRVGFHNIGERQQQGVIVMSIDDGLGLADLDPKYDAILVMINATDESQTQTVPTAAGFELHPILQNSYDLDVQGATFVEGDAEGSFTVPPLTTAVFVKNQADTQGAGLSADATQGAPDVVPYGDTKVYLRGDMNGWSTEMPLNYIGGGKYEVRAELMAATTYNFKFGSDPWDAINIGTTEGGSLALTAGMTETLVSGGNPGNLSFTPERDGTFIFTLDASNKDAPLATIVNEEPFVGVDVYLRGDMNSWSTDNPMVYQGGRVYTASMTLDADTYNFKVADADWGGQGVNFGAESADEASVELATVEYLTAGSQDNLSLTLTETTEVIFILDMSNLEPKLKVFKQNFFADTTALLRGEMNGWGDTDALSYNNDGSYSIDVELEARSYSFKVADADWGGQGINLGATSADEASLTLGESAQMSAGSQDNFSIDIPAAGMYRFTVTGPDATQPSLTVTAL